MQIERILVWLVGLVAIAVSVAAYAMPIGPLPVDPAIAVLGALVALPLLFVFGRLLLNLRGGSRGWS